jgi:pyrophosphatase PpaX
MEQHPAEYAGSAEPLAPVAERLARLRAVLFDLDGTLIDTVELIRVSFRYATKAVLGEALPDELTMANVGQPLRTQFEDLVPGRADELVRVYREFNSAHHDEMVKAYPGTVRVLRQIARHRIPMGVVTSKGTEAALRGLNHFGLADHFGTIITADDVPRHKPDPFPLRAAAEVLAVPLEYCVYVGDSPHDMQAAISGGAIAVAALWGAFSEHDVLAPGPPFALHDIGQLPGLLFGEAGGSAALGTGAGQSAGAPGPQVRRNW